MQANVCRLQLIFEGTIQYIIPYFQRNYIWEMEDWEQLWQDIDEFSDLQTNHFFGPMVTRQIISGPGDVRRYQIIDGQQRITTLFIIFTLIRNKAIENGDIDLAEDIHESFLVNKRQKENYLKLMTSKIDRKPYKSLIEINQPFSEHYREYKSFLYENKESKIIDAYRFFEKKFGKCDNDRLKRIKTVIIGQFEITSQVLDNNDDPYKIYASLNAKGKQLSPVDLIRNFFFECIPDEREQDVVYDELWMPMEVSIKEQLPEKYKEDGLKEYIKHYLVNCQGSRVNEGDIYPILKNNVNRDTVFQHLKKLLNYSNYYKKLLNPELETDVDVRKRLKRLNDIDVTTVYPLLLKFFDYYTEKKINREKLIDVLDTLINFLIRRYVCDIPSNSLNSIFPSIMVQLDEYEDANLISGLKILLSSKDYPGDEEFKAHFKELNYVAGVRGKKIKIILESIEDYYGRCSKEIVFCNSTQIEHFAPQKSKEDQWIKDVADGNKEIYDQYVQNIGNLTLTGYNIELSNKEFSFKKDQLKRTSRFKLNEYFGQVEKWNKEEIEKRAGILADAAIEIWPYFGKVIPNPKVIPTQTMLTTPFSTSSESINPAAPIQLFGADEVRNSRDIENRVSGPVTIVPKEESDRILQAMSQDNTIWHTKRLQKDDIKNVLYLRHITPAFEEKFKPDSIIRVTDATTELWRRKYCHMHKDTNRQINGMTPLIMLHPNIEIGDIIGLAYNPLNDQELLVDYEYGRKHMDGKQHMDGKHMDGKHMDGK